MIDIFDMRSHDYHGLADATDFDAGRIDEERADQHFSVLGPDDTIRARCSIWWQETARVDGARCGAIGHYAAIDSHSGRELLEHASRELAARGCELAISPLDGNTWRRYRFITERGTARPFFLEPDNPDEYPRQFAQSRFRPLAHYVSEINFDILNRQPELGDVPRKMAEQGVRIEPIDASDRDEVLRGIHEVVCAAFHDTFLYTPLDLDSYLRIYAPLLDMVDPRLILVAKHDDRVVGFVFAPPDYNQHLYGETIDTIVIKTIAILPDQRYSGLGRLLIVEMLRNALDMGYTAAISALMQTTNRSQAISSDCAGPMRAYTLFARDLAA